MLKFIMEGLLMQNDMSGYDINLHMQDTQLFKGGFGNIYPTLKKLETAGSIGSRETVEAGRYKKIYTITEKGKKEFLKWLEQPMEIKKANYDYLIKMYFYQHLPQEKVKALIAEFIGNLHALIRRLEVFESVVKKKFDLNDFYFQAATLDYSIDHLRFLRDWYQKFLYGFDKESSNFTIRVSNMGFRIFYILNQEKRYRDGPFRPFKQVMKHRYH